MAVDAAVSKRRLLDLDPDYTDGHIIETKRRCLAEETGQQRVVELVGHELDNALTQKECEALQLQEQVQTCQRLLHVLRYGITSAYYKDAFTEVTPCAPVSALDGRSNLHPAVMRLLGVNASSVQGPMTRATCGKSLVEDCLDQEIQQYSNSDAEGTDSDSGIITKVKEEGKIKDEEKVVKEERKFSEEKERSDESVHLKIPRYVPPNMPEPPTVYATSARVERNRIKRRLVVGNISKWLPEDVREGAASHKWMMYVRGPKDTPDISDIVSKVRYFLHPSYRPHDIADMSYPFYLARRGWGEFPVRVQVHFSMPGNRPIDIIHNLKLDRSYSGLQTLGGETVVDVWLKNMNSSMEEYKVESNQHELRTEFTSVMSTTIFNDGYHETVAHVKAEPVMLDIKEKTLALGEVKYNKHHLDEGTNDLEKVWKTEKICKEEIHKKEFVHHTLPDHDYLGPDTFSLKCFSCEEQQCPDNVVDSVASDAQVMHLSNDMKVSQSTSQQSSYNLKMLDYENQGLPQNVRHNADEIGISVKLEKSNDTMRTGCEFRRRTPASRNGFPPSTSLVQCVDAKGNIFCITLQKPSIANSVLLKDISIKLENSSDPLCNQYTNTVDLKKADSDYSEEILDARKRIVQEKVQGVSVAPVTVGRSLLKRNCLAASSSSPSAPVPSDSSNVQNPGIVGRNVTMGQLHARSLKVNPAPEPAVQLKVAVQLISKMLDDRQVVTWLLEQLPLVHEQTDVDSELKKRHPYAAPSINTFLSWPLAKRHSAERLRANEAYTILQNISGSRFINWSVRHIMRWARVNALTPVFLEKSHGEQAEPKIPADLFSFVNYTVSEPTEVRDWLENVSEASKAAEEMEEVNVEDLGVSDAGIRTSNIRDEAFKCSLQCMPSNAALCGFVRGTVEQLGISLSPETLCPGVSYPAAEQLLFRACQSLCEDLLRKSLHQAWSRCQKIPNEIKLTDVQGALLTRHEFDIFTNAGLGVQAYDAPDDF